jgi:phenylpyruvate tautomerase PptA (4-oxalocrotonate tautomerase family)
MPASIIEVCRVYSSEEEVALMSSVHEALVDAFRIPQKDRNVRLLVHEPSRLLSSPELRQPEYRTIVTIDCFAGKSIEAKRRLYTGIVERLEVLSIPRDHVSVILHEIEFQNWGLGGLPASDIGLGFNVAV